MAQFFTWLLDGSCGQSGLFKAANSARRSHNRVVPDALMLEVRICPSALLPSSRSDHIADISRVTHDDHGLTPLVEQVRGPLATVAVRFSQKAPKAQGSEAAEAAEAAEASKSSEASETSCVPDDGLC